MSKRRTLFFFAPMVFFALVGGFATSLISLFAVYEISYAFQLAARLFMILQGYTLVAFLTALLVFYRAPGEGHLIPPVALCAIAGAFCSVLLFLMTLLCGATLQAGLTFGAVILAEIFLGSLMGYLLANAMRHSKHKRKR